MAQHTQLFTYAESWPTQKPPQGALPPRELESEDLHAPVGNQAPRRPAEFVPVHGAVQCEFVLVCSIKLNSFLNSSFMLLDAPSKARCPVRSLPSLRSVREARASSDRPHLGGRHLHGGLEAGGGTCALWLLRLPGPVRPTRGQSKMWLMLCKVLLATKVVHASSSKTSSTIHSCRASPERSLAQAALR